MLALYRQFSQGISVAACSAMTTITLGYMLVDTHKMEIKQIRSSYEAQIKGLVDENHRLRLENAPMKVNYSDKLNLKY